LPSFSQAEKEGETPTKMLGAKAVDAFDVNGRLAMEGTY
jgi:hypothetical protein